jgi:thiol-disulfide isomerase/thioredoxin
MTEPSLQPITTRRVLLYTVGLTAGLAGLTWAWRQSGWGDVAGKTSMVEAQALWGLSFDKPDGEPLPMKRFQGRPLLINFWATWCPPCIQELPLIESFFKQQGPNGCQVLALAVDQAEPVRQFLRRQPLSFPVALSGAQGMGLTQQLGNTAQGLPFTVLLGAKGQLLQRKVGRLHESDLAQWSQLL